MQVLLVLAGEPPDPELLRSQAEVCDLLVAVDGGLAAFQATGLKPHVVLGDLDSVEEDMLDQEGLSVSPMTDQDLSDLQKALDYVQQQGEVDHYILLGVSGLRTDHFLNNLIILGGLDPSVPVDIYSDTEYIRRVTPACPFSGKLEPGTILSIIPLTNSTSINTTGLKWDLRDATMGIQKTISQSNIVVKQDVNISCGSGSLYIVVQVESHG